MVRTGFSFLKLRIDECHSSILRLRTLFSRSLSELSALMSEIVCLRNQNILIRIELFS